MTEWACRNESVPYLDNTRIRKLRSEYRWWSRIWRPSAKRQGRLFRSCLGAWSQMSIRPTNEPKTLTGQPGYSLRTFRHQWKQTNKVLIVDWSLMCGTSFQSDSMINYPWEKWGSTSAWSIPCKMHLAWPRIQIDRQKTCLVVWNSVTRFWVGCWT